MNLTNIELTFGMKKHRTAEDYYIMFRKIERRFRLNSIKTEKELYANKWAALAEKCWILWNSCWERLDMCEWIVNRYNESIPRARINWPRTRTDK